MHFRITAQENDLPLRRSHSAVRIVLRQSIPQQQFFWAATKKPHRPRGHDRGRHGIAMNMEQPYKRWMGRPRPSLAFKESLPRPKHHFHCPPSLVQPTTTRRRGERKGSPLFCDPCFFARNFLPAHSCVITGSAGREGEGGQCLSCVPGGRTETEGGISCARPRPLMTRGCRRSRSVAWSERCATFLPPVKSD